MGCRRAGSSCVIPGSSTKTLSASIRSPTNASANMLFLGVAILRRSWLQTTLHWVDIHQKPEHFSAKWNPVSREKMLQTNNLRVLYSQNRGPLLRNTRRASCCIHKFNAADHYLRHKAPLHLPSRVEARETIHDTARTPIG